MGCLLLGLFLQFQSYAGEFGGEGVGLLDALFREGTKMVELGDEPGLLGAALAVPRAEAVEGGFELGGLGEEGFVLGWA